MLAYFVRSKSRKREEILVFFLLSVSFFSGSLSRSISPFLRVNETEKDDLLNSNSIFLSPASTEKENEQYFLRQEKENKC